MKKMTLIFGGLFLLLVNSAYALRCGVYQLSGGNSIWGGSSYQGDVIIQPQGENYSVTWKIGTRGQTQTGIGILYNNVLSVAFFDTLTQAWGVVAYRVVADGELEGRWTTYSSYSQKPEYLIWKSY